MGSSGADSVLVGSSKPFTHLQPIRLRDPIESKMEAHVEPKL